MKPRVYVVTNSGNIRDEKFNSDVEASDFAKQQSGISAVMCSIYQTVNNKAFFYENGSGCDAARRRELTKAVEEMIYYNMKKDTDQGKKSR